jgi:hypothetical protein
MFRGSNKTYILRPFNPNTLPGQHGKMIGKPKPTPPRRPAKPDHEKEEPTEKQTRASCSTDG